MPTPKQKLPNLKTLANKFTDLAPVIYMSVLRTKGGSGESRVVQELADKLSQIHHKVLIVTSQKAQKYGHKVRGYDTTPNVPMEIMQALKNSMLNSSFKFDSLFLLKIFQTPKFHLQIHTTIGCTQKLIL